jgi:hypothetical protein
VCQHKPQCGATIDCLGTYLGTYFGDSGEQACKCETSQQGFPDHTQAPLSPVSHVSKVPIQNAFTTKHAGTSIALSSAGYFEGLIQSRICFVFPASAIVNAGATSRSTCRIGLPLIRSLAPSIFCIQARATSGAMPRR